MTEHLTDDDDPEVVPVEIVKPTVQDVKIVGSKEALTGKRKPVPSLAPSLPPTTTLEEDIRTQAQRDLNMTWENTQSLISKIVVFTTCIGVISGVILKAVVPDRVIVLPSEWWAVVGLVIGFYFGRTNHARTSGTASTIIKYSGVNTNPLDDRSH